MIEGSVDKLMHGAYDMHIHAAPSPFRRLYDEYALMEDAAKAGMAGFVMKSHYEPTGVRAQLVNRTGTTCRAFGSIALNWPVGGLNPYAVENALKRKVRIVWMPTRDSVNSLLYGNMPGDFFDRPGISILREDGSLKQEVLQILEIAKKYNAAVATGHLSLQETLILCREGRAANVRMILTHPEFSRTKVPADIQKKLADDGVYIEKCWYNIGEKECTVEEMVANIRMVGSEHCFLSTDRGQFNRESPVEGMRLFFAELLRAGLGKDEIIQMSHMVPEQILYPDDLAD